jgi:hypothetical protein
LLLDAAEVLKDRRGVPEFGTGVVLGRGGHGKKGSEQRREQNGGRTYGAEGHRHTGRPVTKSDQRTVLRRSGEGLHRGGDILATLLRILPTVDDTEDIEQCVQLLTAFARSLSEDDAFGILL